MHRYPGIRAFEPHESSLFFGRSQETKELYQLISVSRLSVLFAKSGIGKSSLLNAGVLPLLTKGVYRVFKARFQDTNLSPDEILRRAIREYGQQVQLVAAAEERLAALKAIVKRAPTVWEELRAYDFEQALGIVPVFIFDQFEEFFLHQPEQRQPFIECIADIAYERVPTVLHPKIAENVLESDDLWGSLLADEAQDDGLSWWRKPLNYKIVLAIRSDRLSLLDMLSDQIPAILNNRYQLHPLGKKQAIEAVTEPARLPQGKLFYTPTFEYKSETLSAIYDNLKNEKGEVESFQLQILCEHVERQVIERKPASPISVSNDYLTKTGDMREGILFILNSYYRQRVDAISPDDSVSLKIRRLIEEGLIMNGVRISLPKTVLEKTYKIEDDLLAKIIDTRIIRAEISHLGLVYEVSHDTLVAPIVRSLEERQAEQRKIEEEKERQRLQAIAAEEKRELEEKAESERKKRRMAYMFTIVAGVLAVIAIITTIYAFIAKNTADQAKEAALTAEKKTADALKSAEKAIYLANIEKLEKLTNEAVEIGAFADGGKSSEAVQMLIESGFVQDFILPRSREIFESVKGLSYQGSTEEQQKYQKLKEEFDKLEAEIKKYEGK